jgi:16S rRNA (uracil1498-N3)-methyltransferase
LLHRCFSAAPVSGDRATLDGAEAHHLLHVLRATAGTRVTLFDGSGWEFDAQVSASDRTTVELAVLARRDVNRELAGSLTLGVPLPKGERQRWIVEKAVELGVTRLVPLATERSVATSEKSAGRLDRYVIEASKQCGRNRLMEIAAPLPWRDWLAAPADARRWIADATGRPIEGAAIAAGHSTYAAVGPEGGLTDDELAAARDAGWETISLGPRVLRIETAALALAAIASLGGERVRVEGR